MAGFEIPVSIEIIVTITLAIIAAAGSVMAYLIADIRTDVKGLREDTKSDREHFEDVDKRLGVVETRMNICNKCPSMD